MNSVLFLVLRRMRLPLILLITSHAISILGMSLVPGVDADGNPAPGLSLFHAFYFVSYTATTIGFGEIPVAFSDAQRTWALVTIYMTVLVWLYSIGTILALLQDPAFRRVIKANAFEHRVRRLRQSFYIICGCGETGALLMQALDRRNQQAVVLDIDADRISELELGQYHLDIPALTGDVRLPENLEAAGLNHPFCAGVIALTNDDQANLAVAVTAKLLRPELPVLCRADSGETAGNMASFGTEEVVNAFEAFGEHLAMALHSPGQHLLYDWLTDIPGMPLSEPLRPPHGKWIICGYGRFGKAVVRNLRREGIELVIVEADPARTDCKDCILGSGTEANALVEAGVRDAVGIVAGTDNDVNNLSIVMTARELKPELFVVIRQNRHANAPLFKRFGANVTMQSADIVGHEFLSLLTTPLLSRFFARCKEKPNDWANELLSRIAAVVGDTVPEVWDVELSVENAVAIRQAMDLKMELTLRDLIRDPANRDADLPCIPLLLGNSEALLPDLDTPLFPGDRILFCGDHGAKGRQVLALRNFKVLNYLLTGADSPGGWFWQWLRRAPGRVARAQK
ncbi:MAG: NAD-binding protein [Gammaproteobacteria bacterium]|nr:NAD-binding protein [Gammaproteobacteria bacterium]